MDDAWTHRRRRRGGHCGSIDRRSDRPAAQQRRKQATGAAPGREPRALGGAVAAGLGAFLYLFGPGGGYGPGQGPGGEGPGGTEKTSHNDPKDSDSKSSEKKKADGNEGTRTPTELRVGVLSYGALKPDDAKKKRCYRIITAGGPEMKSLGGVKQFIVDLKTPPSVVYLVDFEDAADADRMAADKMLRELAGDLKKNPDQWVKPAPEPHPSPRP